MENKIEKIKMIVIKNKEIFMYLIFGVLTTLVNYVSYLLSTKILDIDYMISTCIAWVLSVLFAYITNKIYVFNSKTSTKKEIASEALSFFGFRLLSGIMDLIFMYIFVDLMHLDDSIMKLVSNIIIIIVNYLFSKIFIFKEKN